MPEPQSAPYGSWKSPLSAEQVIQSFTPSQGVAFDGKDIYWAEGRPLEGGRTVIVRHAADGNDQDLTPAGFNLRSRVHEYGGGAWCVQDGLLVFSNFKDGRIYRQQTTGDMIPRAISPEGPFRYADFEIDQPRHRLICVREDHNVVAAEAVNTLVSVDLDGARSPSILVSGHNFYSNPRLSPDGMHLAWLAWNHPN